MGGGIVRIMKVGVEPDPERRIRQEWAESLNETLAIVGMSRKQLRHALAERGVRVTEQAIGCWLRGEKAPRPYYQAVIAGILGVPVRRLFPIEAVA